MATLLNGDHSTRIAPPRGGSMALEDAPRPGQGPAPEGGSATPANQTLAGMMKSLDSIAIHNQHDLHQVLEALRKVVNYLSVQALCAANEVEAGAKEMAKAEATLGIVGLGVRVEMRRVTKAMEGGANHLMQASTDFVKAWHAMERFLDDINGAQKPAKPKSFTIERG